jgi:hypothetical protein
MTNTTTTNENAEFEKFDELINKKKKYRAILFTILVKISKLTNNDNNIVLVYKVGVKSNLNNFERKLWISYPFGRLVDLLRHKPVANLRHDKSE